MRTDTIFYQLFLIFPNLLFELLEQPPVEGYQFSSREIKELARRFDGIFMPPENDIKKPIYFVEVQFQDREDFWWRFLAEIFVYLGQYKPQNEWLIIALFASRKFDPGLPDSYEFFLSGGKVKIFYLDELDISEKDSLSLEVVSLVVSKEAQALKIAQGVTQEANETITNTTNKTKVLELIETILIYKLKNMNRREIEAMFTLDELQETQYIKDLKADFKLEGKLETIPLLIELGMSLEDIATKLNLPLKLVQEASQS